MSVVCDSGRFIFPKECDSVACSWAKPKITFSERNASLLADCSASVVIFSVSYSTLCTSTKGGRLRAGEV